MTRWHTIVLRLCALTVLAIMVYAWTEQPDPPPPVDVPAFRGAK